MKRRKGGPSHAISGPEEVIASLPQRNPFVPVSYAPATRTNVLTEFVRLYERIRPLRNPYMSLRPLRKLYTHRRLQIHFDHTVYAASGTIYFQSEISSPQVAKYQFTTGRRIYQSEINSPQVVAYVRNQFTTGRQIYQSKFNSPQVIKYILSSPSMMARSQSIPTEVFVPWILFAFLQFVYIISNWYLQKRRGTYPTWLKNLKLATFLPLLYLAKFYAY